MSYPVNSNLIHLDLLLMDEPFGALDAIARDHAQCGGGEVGGTECVAAAVSANTGFGK